MAVNAADADDCRARELDLLTSGNFSDIKAVCGERVWKCHRAILASRSVWFRKALSGPFQEASSRRVNLEEKDPIFVDLALKHIYGNGLDVESSISPDHFMGECVSLWQTADFLLLNSLKSSVEKAVHNYCDRRMKQLCTRLFRPKWANEIKGKLTAWAIDMIIGIRGAYRWNVEGLKAVLVEFTWAGRRCTLDARIVSTTLDHLKDTPAFVADLLAFFASTSSTKSAVWAPHRSGRTWTATCRRCGTEIFWGNNEQAEGQILDPFGLDGGLGWCRDCGNLDMTPWREGGANDH
ncbi:hypothetical protein INS49_005336 [Diaporthe citri]|uniref:uncharacterized protein n=1 Tax=Diaporthe citri TaxID=83186 RepID=UPI001C805D4F|nr:uncharacterized protein INS49_005336 [Diaporthe citri]KAG6353628.1 hypothetical protein INS49_005336 [Diaporthe citri]